MWLLAAVHPAPPANPPDGSLAEWVWLTVVVAIVVVGTMAFTWRR
jgi:hypothetical protein